MITHTKRSTYQRAMLDEASGLRLAVSGGDALLEGPDGFKRGLPAELPFALLAGQADLRAAKAVRMVLNSGAWRPQETLDRSYPGAGMLWFDDRPRTSRLGPFLPWSDPYVVALERKLEATRRELRQALLSLKEVSEGAGFLTEVAVAAGERSRTTWEKRVEVTEGSQRTCCDTAVADLPHHAHTVAPTERPEPAQGVEHHSEPTEADCPAVDDAPFRLLTRIVFVVVDDGLRDAVLGILRSADMEAVCCASGEALLQIDRRGPEACLLTGTCVAGVGGLDLVDRLRAAGGLMPTVLITGRGDVPMAVRATRAGVSDVIEEPVGREELLTCVGRAFERAGDAERALGLRVEAARHVAGLTRRQREVMTSVLAGHPSKNIASDLGISRRTVENHRASIMRKTGTRSLPALARLALAAEPTV